MADSIRSDRNPSQKLKPEVEVFINKFNPDFASRQNSIRDSARAALQELSSPISQVKLNQEARKELQVKITQLEQELKELEEGIKDNREAEKILSGSIRLEDLISGLDIDDADLEVIQSLLSENRGRKFDTSSLEEGARTKLSLIKQLNEDLLTNEIEQEGLDLEIRTSFGELKEKFAVPLRRQKALARQAFKRYGNQANEPGAKEGLQREISAWWDRQDIMGTESYRTFAHNLDDYRALLSEATNNLAEYQELLAELERLSTQTELYEVYCKENEDFSLEELRQHLIPNDLTKATQVVTLALATIDSNNFEPKLAELTNGATTNPELIAEFLLAKEPDTLTDPQALQVAIRLINGDKPVFNNQAKASSQAYLRSYLDFLKTKEIQLPDPDIVVSLPKLTGIHNKEELIAAIKAQGYHCSSPGVNLKTYNKNDPKDAVAKYYEANGRSSSKKVFNNQNREGVVEYIARIANDIGQSPEEMYRLAEIPDIETYYDEPIQLCYQYLTREGGFETDQSNELKQAVQHRKEEINARNFLNSIFADYSLYTDITVSNPPENQKAKKDIKIGVIRDRFLFTEVEDKTLLSNCVFYSNRDGRWQAEDQIGFLVASVFCNTDLSKNIDLSKEANTDWFMGLSSVQETETLKNSMEGFLRSKDASLSFNNNSKKIHGAIKVLLGTKSQPEEITDPSIRKANQDLFREWVKFLEMDLDKVITKFPKLTGAKDLRELKLISDQYRKDNNLELDLGPETNDNRPEEVISKEIFPLAGITTTDVENFPDYKRLRQHYQNGLSTILTNIINDRTIIPTILDPASSKILQLIVASELFPESRGSIARTIRHGETTNLPLVLNIAYNFVVAYNPEKYCEINFNQQDQEWKLRLFSNLFDVFGEVVSKLKLPPTDLLYEGYENFLASSSARGPDSINPLSLCFRLVDDFLVQTFPSTPITDPKIRTASHAILGSSKVLGPSINPTTRSEAFQYLRNFVSFANDRYPGFAEIPQLRAILEAENQDPVEVGEVSLAISKENKEWLDHLKSKFRETEIIEKMRIFLDQNSNLRANSAICESSKKILCGDLKAIKEDPETNQQIFRDWALFLGMDLDEVIAEFPKLTGVKDLREARLALHRAYPDFNTIYFEATNKTLAAVQMVEELLGIDTAKLDSLLNLPDVNQVYSGLLEMINTDNVLLEDLNSIRDFLNNDLKIRSLWDKANVKRYFFRLNKNERFSISVDSKFCSGVRHSETKDPPIIYDARSFDYSPEQNTFVLAEKLSKTALEIESIYLSQGNELLNDRREKFERFTVKAFGRRDQAGQLLSNLIAEYLDQEQSLINIIDTLDQINHNRGKGVIQKILRVFFKIDKDISGTNNYVESFINFANNKYPNFKSALEEFYASLGLTAQTNPNLRASQSSPINISSRTATQTPTTNEQETKLKRQEIIKLLSKNHLQNREEIFVKDTNLLIKTLAEKVQITEEELFNLATPELREDINNFDNLVEEYLKDVATFIENNQELKEIRSGKAYDSVREFLGQDDFKTSFKYALLRFYFNSDEYQRLDSIASQNNEGPNISLVLKRDSYRLEKHKPAKEINNSTRFEWDVVDRRTGNVTRHTNQ